MYQLAYALHLLERFDWHMKVKLCVYVCVYARHWYWPMARGIWHSILILVKWKVLYWIFVRVRVKLAIPHGIILCVIFEGYRFGICPSGRIITFLSFQRRSNRGERWQPWWGTHFYWHFAFARRLLPNWCLKVDWSKFRTSQVYRLRRRWRHLLSN